MGAAGIMGFIESLPVRDGLVFALCPFTGSILDCSGNGRHPTVVAADANWRTRGDWDGLTSSGTGHLLVANDDELEAITDLSVFVAGPGASQGGIEVIIGKADAGGVQFSLHSVGEILTLADGAGVTATLAGLANADSFAVSLVSGATGTAYINGASPVAFSGTSTITANDAPTTILNYFTGAWQWTNPTKLLLWYSRALSAAENLLLNNWSVKLFTPRKQWPGGGLDIPTLLTEPEMPMFLDNIQSARVTLANQTSGKLSNTPYTIESGTWALSEDATTGERYIECVAGGVISRRNIDAYGTWEIETYKALDASTTNLILCAQAPNPPAGVGKNVLQLHSTEAVRLVLNNAVPAKSAPGYVDIATRIKTIVTRALDNSWTFYTDGKLVSTAGGSGTNPVVNGAVTTSVATALDLDTGDRIYSDRQFAGVVSPV